MQALADLLETGIQLLQLILRDRRRPDPNQEVAPRVQSQLLERRRILLSLTLPVCEVQREVRIKVRLVECSL